MNSYDWNEKPELNITPLVDVMLVLLAILMLITPNIVYNELIKLPQGSAQQELSKAPPISIVVYKNKHITVNGNNFQFDSFADNFLRFAQNLSKKSTVTISADRSLGYGDVMKVLASVKRAGFSEVSLATDGY
jgi:biopolymer transport protein ExbD